MKSIFQILLFRPFTDELFNIIQFIGTACLKTTRIMEDKTVSCGIHNSLLDVVLSTLANI